MSANHVNRGLYPSYIQTKTTNFDPKHGTPGGRPNTQQRGQFQEKERLMPLLDTLIRQKLPNRILVIWRGTVKIGAIYWPYAVSSAPLVN